MEGAIYLIGSGDQLTEMRQAPYDSESVLQTLLAKYPDLLAGDQMNLDEPRRWLLIDREVAMPNDEDAGAKWSVDHLFIDQSGIPTIVEVKRSSDTRIRREVIGQMLDYAANAVIYWPVESLRSRFEARCARTGQSPDTLLSAHLGEGADPEGFWQEVKTNLQAGKVRLVLVADEIPAESRRVVEFLNAQMDPAEVVAVEVKQYVGADLKTLVPRVLGQTKNPPPSTRQWDEASFFAELAGRFPRRTAEVETARTILEWGKHNCSYVWWGRGKKDGSFFPMLEHRGTSHWLVSVWTYGRVTIQFGMMKTREPFASEERRCELLQRFNALEGIAISESAIGAYPSVPLAALAKTGALKQFLGVLDWVVEQVRKSDHPADIAAASENPG